MQGDRKIKETYQKLIMSSFSTAYPSEDQLIELARFSESKRFKELLSLPINNNFKISGLLILMDKGEDLDVIKKLLDRMGSKALDFFVTCVSIGKTGKRVKKLFKSYLRDKGKDRKFVILNKRKLNYLLRKLHVKREDWNEEMLDFIFSKKAKRGTLYYKYLQMSESPQELPFSVVIGSLPMYTPNKRKAFLRRISKKITPNEAAKYFRMFKRYGIDVTGKLKNADPLRVYKLYRLGLVPIDVYLRSVENFAKKVKIPKEMQNAVVVFDDSESIRKTNSARFNDILLVFVDVISKQLPVFRSNGEKYNINNRRSSYKTSLIPGIAKAMNKSKTILLVTDGYENFPALLTDKIMHSYGNSGEYSFAQIVNSKGVKISGIPAVGIRNVNQINDILLCLSEVMHH